MSVKRLSIAILAFFYLGLTSGVVKSIHYCMGQLSNVEYGYDEHEACGKCGMQEKDGCCDTEMKLVKVEDSHQGASWSSIEKKSINLPAPGYPSSFLTAPITQREYSIAHHSPPDRRMNLVYLHTGALLI